MRSKASYAKQQLNEFKEEVGVSLDRYFDEVEKDIHDNYDSNTESLEVLKTLRLFTCSGGKRLRAAFVYNTYHMLGGNRGDIAMRAAVAIEIIHAYLLIEDDFMDLSDERRNNPTAHKILKEYHIQNFNRGDSEHLGVSLALLASMMGSHLAMGIINSLEVDDHIIRRLNINLNQRLITTVHGQINDVMNEVKDDVREEDVLNVLRWKTAAYTYENPIHFGAILAGADDQTLEKLSRFAIPAGVAFQIQDDILGVYGNTKKTGKSNMDDIKEGKITLLTYYALKDGNPDQVEYLRKCLGNRELTEEEHKKVQQIIIDTKALERSKEIALNYVEEAKKNLFEVRGDDWTDEGFDSLVGIADFMIEREL